MVRILLNNNEMEISHGFYSDFNTVYKNGTETNTVGRFISVFQLISSTDTFGQMAYL